MSTTSTADRPGSTRSRRPTVDAACAEAVEPARAAAVELARPGEVGEHLGVRADGDRMVTHSFASTKAGYSGWYWAVTVVRAPRSKSVTVAESVLLPGEGAILAPEWVPWHQRLQPGDLRPGDLLPTAADDDRLEPGYQQAGGTTLRDEEADRVALWELGLGRHRVLSPVGRDDAVDRWYSGERGPAAPSAAAAPAPCSTCGFLLQLGGSLRTAFGVCANEYSPSDGRVVSMDHGCGAHSEAAVLPVSVPVAESVPDGEGYDLVALRPEAAVGSADDSEPAEDLGRS